MGCHSLQAGVPAELHPLCGVCSVQLHIPALVELQLSTAAQQAVQGLYACAAETLTGPVCKPGGSPRHRKNRR